ncbi:VOC family protein [Actomonas aquatica]|uniref:VOC family protein n=1 Tax=Actomonas aquatica TaxID=2866162 RepID=A0ABZ1C7L3_9BACT|nr:VOC family protein [Opitutus sp. WL0086]WRQ87704.1 VOC family protein [Opitutus sp. WL0086]
MADAKPTSPRVTGLGGIFFKAQDQATLSAWYRDRLGLPVEDWGGCSFKWREDQDPSRKGTTAWSAFPADTTYFEPSKQPFMMNFRVANLDQLLSDLAAEGVQVLPNREESEFGKFGWVIDPEGNKVELWEPPVSEQAD